MNMKLGKMVVAALLCVLAGSTQGTDAHAQGLKSLRMTIPVNSLTFYPVFVAQDTGLFKQQGVEFEIVITQGDGPDVDALLAGSVEFTATPPHRLLVAYEQGRKLLGIVNLMNKVAINCFMNKKSAERVGITPQTPLAEKIKKLKGLTIGATRAGAFTFQLATHYVKRGGYTPQTDVQIIGAGAGPSMLAAVEQARVDIGCISSPTPELAIHRGTAISWVNNTIGEDSEFSDFLMEVLYVRPDYAEKNPDLVRRVSRALVEAIQFIVHAPDMEHLPILRNRFSGVPDEVLLQSLKNTRAAMEPTGRISQRSVEAHIEFLKQAGLLQKDIPWNAVVTNEYLPK
jgi:ABC-type nitrate/sulfonate/bicarbonate transport system substrate-binding protein